MSNRDHSSCGHTDFSQHWKIKGGVKLDHTLDMCFFLEEQM